MTPEILEWAARIITAEDVAGKDVLEVGSQDVNGSVRPHITSLGPKSYLGVDSDPGFLNPLTSQFVAAASVDQIVRGEDLVEVFGLRQFDMVVSTEMLEHARNWQDVVWNMMAVTRNHGLMVITTRSVGFPYHPYPEDCWRFSRGDFEQIWAGWEIEDLREDPGNPGVFLRARRPTVWEKEPEWERLAGLTVTPQRKDY